MVPAGYEFVIYLAAAIHGAATAALIVHTLLSKRARTKKFPILFGSNFVLFAAMLFVIPSYIQLNAAVDLLAFIVYTVLGSYVVTIEVPGYLLLSRFDDRLSGDLQEIRKGIVSLNYSSVGLKTLESKISSMKAKLKDLLIDDVVENFVASHKRMAQIDRTLYDVTLKELGEVIHDISNRSKHPFPKLIEVLSLAGISFLIGQFLNYFLP